MMRTSRQSGSILSCLKNRKKATISPEERILLDEYVEEQLAVREKSVIKCTLPDTTRSTFLVAFSPDGKTIASTHGDHTIRITDLKTCRCKDTLSGHPRTPWSITFHPSNSNLLASGCLGGMVRVWNLTTGKTKVYCPINGRPIASLAFHPVDMVLLIATGNQLECWNWQQAKPFASVNTNNPQRSVKLVKFNKTGDQLLTGVRNPLNLSLFGLRWGSCNAELPSCQQHRGPRTAARVLMSDNHTTSMSQAIETTTPSLSRNQHRPDPSNQEQPNPNEQPTTSGSIPESSNTRLCSNNDENSRRVKCNASGSENPYTNTPSLSRNQQDRPDLNEQPTTSSSIAESSNARLCSNNDENSRQVKCNASGSENQPITSGCSRESSHEHNNPDKEYVIVNQDDTINGMASHTHASEDNLIEDHDAVSSNHEASTQGKSTTNMTISSDEGSSSSYVSVENGASSSGQEQYNIQRSDTQPSTSMHGDVTDTNMQEPITQDEQSENEVLRVSRNRNIFAQTHTHVAQIPRNIQAGIDYIIAEGFAASGYSIGMASNLTYTTYQLQLWDFTKLDLPNIADSVTNVIVKRCKISNDASVDMSADGRLLCAIVPNLGKDLTFGSICVFSLERHNRGQCIFSRKFCLNAISVSLSPLGHHLLVGMASLRTFFIASSVTMAQIFKLNDATKTMHHVSNLKCPHGVHDLSIGTNAAFWIPSCGAGMVYGTNKGELFLCHV